MNRSESETTTAAIQYALRRSVELEIKHPLGIGQDGIVWASTRDTAVKGFYRPQNYEKERDCYFRLQEFCMTEICGLAVPQLVAHDDELMMVEMGIVSPPRVLDFGKAYLDRQPDYPPELLADSMEEFRTNYAQDDWETVLEVVDVLRSIGIYYYDLRPGNIQVRRKT